MDRMRSIGRGLALVALLCLGAGGAIAAEPPTLVLQLPATVGPEQLKQLVQDLQAHGAVAVASTAPPAAVPPAGYGEAIAGTVEQIWQASGRALAALPQPAQLAAAWQAQRTGPRGFWLLALAGALAGLGAEAMVRTAGLRLLVPKDDTARRHRAGLAYVGSIVAGLAAFALVLAAILRADSGDPLAADARLHVVAALLWWRGAVAVVRTLLAPGRPALRLLAVSDADAARPVRWISGYILIGQSLVVLAWLLERLGFGHDAVFGTALTLGLGVTLYKILMFLALRRPIAEAVLKAGGSMPGPIRRAIAAVWHWVFIALGIGIYALLAIEFSIGGASASSTGTAAVIQSVVVVLSLAWAAKQRLLFKSDGVPDWRRKAVGRLADTLLLAVGAVWLVGANGGDLLAPAPGSFTASTLRPLFEAWLTLAIGYALWRAADEAIAMHLPQTLSLADGDEDGPASATRLETILPLVRNLAAVTIGFVATLVALSHIGVDIGPLLAGAGVVGIALGFGAQALVRDIISGVFFLIEDAFRVGEYIDTGRLKGTVEGMSLRSVRLRHQSGQVHTIPFGQIQAVTNASRDWAVVKFNLQLAPGTDFETIRKSLKRIGEALLDDPEIGPEFIQPLKLQGIVDITQAALVVRCKFTARPARSSYLQYQALRRVVEHFGETGIAFAAPTVAPTPPPPAPVRASVA